MATLSELKRHYVKAIQEGYAAIFAGAGLSRPSGFVDWKDLLRDLAEEIQLDVDKEADLVEVAQYYCNEKRGRGEINDRILNRFVTESQENISIQLLAEMSIHTYWTTNYDHLLEDTLKNHEKHIDIKTTPESLATTLCESDAIIYKMHGDYLDPSTCIITKDDYELYNEKRQLFTTALQGDLVTKTFLFIGFSFEDPNLKYILSRIRNLLNENRRTHYCLLKKIDKQDYCNDKDYYYDLNKQNLRIHDLKRYGIEAVLIDHYNEIPDILKEIQKASKCNNIFISGAAHEYGKDWESTAPLFIKHLVKTLYRYRYRIITGHARGIGSYVISSIIEECQSNVSKLEKHLMIKAFPYEDKNRPDYTDIRTEYREGIFKHAGIAIFMFGNKLVDNQVILADGVYEEFEIAKKFNAYIIPIGSTGYVANNIWKEVHSNLEKYPYLKSEINVLQECTDPKRITSSIINVLANIQKNF
ncbi:SIR2 family protein [Anaerovorax odorimutans]|uniref:NAD(+) hydrolase ThsA n=1 Tax=Anaerovorax odorimutans TaxID=109327 RepID=A0ABT1RTY7_9FIRM|nr:SIR2 family protein [Anaerovorax odorimutans]MCQ4638611.1 SIR2 family protein [Anaerovorax odorimutans]